eukprot:152065_1
MARHAHPLASPYVQTASYFIFKSIISLISSFVSVTLLTIHRIEYDKNTYDETILHSPRHASKVKKKTLKQFTSIQTIINRLTWAILILFCSICIVYELLTIIAQVGRVNEVTYILCTKWTVRIFSACIQFGIGLMHCLFLARLYDIYQNTPLAFNPCTLKAISAVFMVLTIICSILLLLSLHEDGFKISFLDQEHGSCNIVVPTFINYVIGASELFVVLCILYLFVKPLRGMLKLHKALDNEIEFAQADIFKANKISTLALTATILTAIMAFIMGWSHATWASFVVMPINSICLIFMTDYYPKGHRRLCCLFILCTTQLFRRDNQAKLKSDKMYVGMTNRDSKLIVDLKGDDHQQDTEAYFQQNTLQLQDAPSYDPFGVGKTDSPSVNQNCASYATLSAPQHKTANTMELKMMDVTPLAVAKQTKSTSIDTSDEVEEHPHDTNRHLLDVGMDHSGSYDNINTTTTKVDQIEMQGQPSTESTHL